VFDYLVNTWLWSLHRAFCYKEQKSPYREGQQESPGGENLRGLFYLRPGAGGETQARARPEVYCFRNLVVIGDFYAVSHTLT
jgi:hypothetical protein